jgi:hypothetical protein
LPDRFSIDAVSEPVRQSPKAAVADSLRTPPSSRKVGESIIWIV